MNQDIEQYFLCLEYNNPITKKYGKSYISFNENGLIYDVIYRYSMEQIDYFLACYSKSQLLDTIKKDNVLYFLNESLDSDNIKLSIHHYDIENNKERISAPILKDGCYFFDMEKFLKSYMTVQDRKLLHNKLGGYLTNNHILENTKQFIQHFQGSDPHLLWEEYSKLPYQEQRKIKMIIYDHINPDLQIALQNREQNKILKKDLAS